MNQVPFPIEKAAGLIREPGTLGLPLLVICLAAYGEEVFGSDTVEPMDPLDLYERLKDDFRAQLTEEGENRLNALMLAIATDGFYEDPLIFVSVTKALNTGDLGELPDGVMEEVELPEALWAVYEVGLCRDDDIGLEPRVLAVIEGALAKESREVEEGEEEVSPEDYIASNKLDLANQLLQLGLQMPLGELGAASAEPSV